MSKFSEVNTEIQSLGEAKINSPILSEMDGTSPKIFKTDDDRILIDVNAADINKMIQDGHVPSSFELAGPRKKIFLIPASSNARSLPAGAYARDLTT
ncbi:MAG: hypothetical protein ACLFRF_10430 [Desulfobacterales bacterium]